MSIIYIYEAIILIIIIFVWKLLALDSILRRINSDNDECGCGHID